jgi:hypothetical protein
MSCQSNEILMESILMNTMGMEESDMIEELGGEEYCEKYGWTDYDDLLDALVEKRYEEDPRQM